MKNNFYKNNVYNRISRIQAFIFLISLVLFIVSCSDSVGTTFFVSGVVTAGSLNATGTATGTLALNGTTYNITISRTGNNPAPGFDIDEIFLDGRDQTNSDQDGFLCNAGSCVVTVEFDRPIHTDRISFSPTRARGITTNYTVTFKDADGATIGTTVTVPMANAVDTVPPLAEVGNPGGINTGIKSIVFSMVADTGLATLKFKDTN